MMEAPGRLVDSQTPVCVVTLTSEVCFCHSSRRMGAESSADRMAR